MHLGSRTTAEFANAIARALALTDANGTQLVFEEPRSARETDALYTRLGTALDASRPSKHAPSVGALVTMLVWGKGASRPNRRWPAPPAIGSKTRDTSRRALAELIEVVAQGSYERTKRAERGRIMAELLLLFDLESFVDVELGPAVDGENALRRVRRALAAR